MKVSGTASSGAHAAAAAMTQDATMAIMSPACHSPAIRDGGDGHARQDSCGKGTGYSESHAGRSAVTS
jgi:hypothetical protein